jgi:Protein of unknown function (DUF1566)
MQTLGNKLRSVIEDQLRSATPRQVLAIASALCTDEVEIVNAAAAPAPARFEIRDEVVLDRRTGLMWTRGNVPGGRMPWATAQKAAAGVSLGGHSDWRLPTIRELLTIVDYERSSPSIDTSLFECESAWYWSATPYKPSPGGYAWFVNFNDGYSSALNLDGSRVRPRRARRSVSR